MSDFWKSVREIAASQRLEDAKLRNLASVPGDEFNVSRLGVDVSVQDCKPYRCRLAVKQCAARHEAAREDACKRCEVGKANAARLKKRKVRP